MDVLTTLLSKEENRNNYMLAEYCRELETLPKGTIKAKKVKKRLYYYLIFRSGDKVITKYLGKSEEKLVSIREQLARRKQVEEIIKKLTEEKAKILKLEAAL